VLGRKHVANRSKDILQPAAYSHERSLRLGKHLLLQNIAKLAIGPILQQAQQSQDKGQSSRGKKPARVFRNVKRSHEKPLRLFAAL
jgi:hypothetical protein